MDDEATVPPMTPDEMVRFAAAIDWFNEATGSSGKMLPIPDGWEYVEG